MRRVKQNVRHDWFSTAGNVATDLRQLVRNNRFIVDLHGLDYGGTLGIGSAADVLNNPDRCRRLCRHAADELTAGAVKQLSPITVASAANR